MLLAELVGQTERDDFAVRQLQITETAQFYGLNATNSLLLGGTALARYGLNTYLSDLPGNTPFDVDAILLVPPEQRLGLSARLRDLRFEPIIELRRREAPLHLTLFRGTAAQKIATRYLGYASYEAMVADRVVLGDLATIPLDKLLTAKLSSSSLKDAAGVIKAYAIVRAEGRDAAYGPVLRTHAENALSILTARKMARQVAAYTGWLQDLLPR